MATHRYTGMEQNGAHHRCRVDLPEPEAAFVSALADEGAITPADVIRGIVRKRRREVERAAPGGSSTPQGQT